MLLPWVARRAYDALSQHAAFVERQNDDLKVQLEAWGERYHALRLTGHVPGRSAVPVDGLSPQPSDLAIEDTVRKFGGNPRLRRALQLYQQEQRRQNVSEADIVDQVTTWRDPDSDADDLPDKVA